MVSDIPNHVLVKIQDDSGKQVNILRGDIIGHFEKKKVHTNMCLILTGYRDRAV
jgi:hypothetical protein